LLPRYWGRFTRAGKPARPARWACKYRNF